MTTPKKKTALTAATLFCSSLLGSGLLCASAQNMKAVRLVVGDSKNMTLSVLDTKTGNVLSSFGMPGKLTGLYTGPAGNYVYAMHRAEGRMSVLHSGLNTVSHGDHDDLQENPPYVLATLKLGKAPTHFFNHDNRIAVYNDGDGTVNVFGEELLGITNDMQIVKSAKADHGAPALLGDILLTGMLSLNRVDVFDVPSNKLLKSIEGCEGIHGEALAKTTTYFGCADGVLAVTVNGQEITSTKIANPSGAGKTRVSLITSHPKSSTIYGNFGQGLSFWNESSKSVTPLPMSAAPLRFRFSPSGEHLVVLGMNGELHTIAPATGKITQTLKGLTGYDPADKNAVIPAMIVGDEHVYVTNPKTSEIFEIPLAKLEVKRKMKFAGTATHLALAQAEGVKH